KWVFGAAYDVNEVKGPTGDEYQWATASAAFITKSWIVPGIRLGYRVNQAGSELSYLTGGITLFKYLNIDGAYGLEEVVIDGSAEKLHGESGTGIIFLITHTTERKRSRKDAPLFKTIHF
ncbi:MAG: hypothetical protein AMJ55_11335, partial [Gammaproteobacteria bacterium SG8_15]